MPLHNFTPAEVIVSDRRRMETSLLGMVWLGIAAASISEGITYHLLAGTLAVGINLLAVFRAAEVSLHRWIVNTSVIVSTIVLAVEMISPKIPTLAAIEHYLVLIQICKLFERKTNRDYVQLLSMSVLLMVAAGIQSRSVYFAAAWLGHTVLACHTGMVLTLKRGLDTAATVRLRGELAPPPPQQVAWNALRNWPGPALRREGTALVATILLVGLTFFLLAPRSGIKGPGGLSGDAGEAETGFSSSLHLGGVRSIYRSSEVAMRVRIRPLSPNTALPSSLYLRGQTFENYAPSISSWSATTMTTSPPWPTPSPEVLDGAFAQEITLAADSDNRLFACQPVVRFTPSWYVSSANDKLDAAYSLTPKQTVQYTAVSLQPPLNAVQRQFVDQLRKSLEPKIETYPAWWGEGPPPDSQPFSRPEGSWPGMHRRRRQPWGISPDVELLAAEWKRQFDPAWTGDNPSGRSVALASYFATMLQQRCTYTLNLEQTSVSRDAVVDFLFKTHKGHCEYFATALTLLCRSAGLQARLATGYLADASNLVGDTYIVRGRDAHAWTEVFDEQSGWVVVDATPSGAGQPSESAWWQRLQDRFSGVEFWWQRNVVGYGNTTRGHLWDSLVGVLKQTILAVKNAWNSLLERFQKLLAFGQMDAVLWVVILIIVVTTLAAELLLVLRFWKRLAMKLRQRRDPLMAAQKKMEFLPRLFEQMERKGLIARRDWTLRQIAQSAVEQFDLPADSLMKLVDLHHRLRWGRHVPDNSDIAAAQAIAEQLARRLKTI